MAWLLAVHVLGVILWIAGALGAGRVLLDHRSALGRSAVSFAATERSLLLRTAIPGMALAFLAGSGALALSPGYYLREGWMHAKLAASAIALVATVALAAAGRRLSASPEAQVSPPGERGIRLWRAVLLCAACAALILVFVKPF